MIAHLLAYAVARAVVLTLLVAVLAVESRVIIDRAPGGDLIIVPAVGTDEGGLG